MIKFKDIVAKVLLFILPTFNCVAHSKILFNGDWGNYVDYYYQVGTGWRNIIPRGQPVENSEWSDFNAYWKKATPHTWLFQTSSAPDRIQIEKDPESPHKGYVAKFVVKSGDHRVIHSGERSEMYTMLDANAKKLHVGDQQGREFYGIAVKVSKDWLPPQKEGPNKGYVQWGTFMQLHSPNIYDSPPALDLSVDDSYSLRLNSGELISYVPDIKKGGLKQRRKDSQKFEFSNGKLNPGQWVQFMIDVNWDSQPNGHVRIYRRDEGEKNFKNVLVLTNIPTLQTSEFISKVCQTCAPDNIQHYWRVGFYRSTSPGQTNTLWLGRIVRGTTFKEVADAAFGSSGQAVDNN